MAETARHIATFATCSDTEVLASYRSINNGFSEIKTEKFPDVEISFSFLPVSLRCTSALWYQCCNQ